MNRDTIARPGGRAFIAAVTGAWCTYLIIDFLANAVFLAPYWHATESYWLPPAELFRAIPVGYISFGIYCAALTWLLARLYGAKPRLVAGLRFGATSGLLFGLISTLGSYSIFRMPDSALMVWPLTAIVQSAGAGAVASWVLTALHPWRRVGFVLGSTLLLFVLGVVAQNLLLPKIR